MCLAIPGKILSRDEDPLAPMAKVEFMGIAREVSLAYVPEAQVGDYVLVHVGFAISRVDPDEAVRTLALLDELGELEAPPEGPS